MKVKMNDAFSISVNQHELLLKFLFETFPQFKVPEVTYEEISEPNGTISYKAQFKLLGQTFNSGCHCSRHEALESVSGVAFEVVKEFQNLILLQTDASINCEALSSLLRPVKIEAGKVASTVTQEALKSVSEIKSRLVEVENENINLKVKTKSEKIIEKMQGSIQMNKPEPVKVSKIEKPVTPVQDIDTSVSMSPLKLEESEKLARKTTNIGAPIPTFYEFVEKQSSSEVIVFDDFVKGQCYGCRLRWGKRFWVAPAEYRQKKDAHNFAAVMACVELFGEGFTFEGIDPRLYHNLTRESVRIASDKYSFGTSEELLSNEPSSPIEIEVQNIKIEPLSDGRKFLSVINEICQKMRFTPPNYQVASVNALTNYYVCTIKNFHDLPTIESAPFTKKNEAKEDAAGRIYYFLKQKGIVDEASRIIGRQKAMEMSASRSDFERPIANRTEYTRMENNRNDAFKPNNVPVPFAQFRPPHLPGIPITQHAANVSIPPPVPPISPIIPAMPPNMNMMQMMPMFMMAQMTAQQSSMVPSSQSTGQLPFDPNMMQNFMNMTRQWQAFLAWQQQNQNVPETNQVINDGNNDSVRHEQYPTNSSNSVTHNHGSQTQGSQNHSHQQHRRPPPRDPRLRDNNYSRKRYFEEDPRRR